MSYLNNDLLSKLPFCWRLYILGPAPTDFTDRIYEFSESIATYTICKDLKCNFNEVGTNSFRIGDEERNFTVEVIDPVDDYLEMMKNIFDFGMIRSYLKSYKALLNSLHGGLYLILLLHKNKFTKIYTKPEILTKFAQISQLPDLT